MTENDRLSDIAKYYDQETFAYDDGYSSYVCKAEDAIVRNILLRTLKGKILDIGAGSGLMCEMLDIEDYFGIEISPQMTQLAKRKFPEKSLSIADMHHLPFKSNSFSTIVSLYGPFSYSLEPDKLIDEILRVTQPGGAIVLMPYSLRVAHKLDIGGYSTATEESIKKIFYTEEKLREVLNDLSSVSVFGINYFLNTYFRFMQTMNPNFQGTTKEFEDFLQLEAELGSKLPAECARHMVAIGYKPY